MSILKKIVLAGGMIVASATYANVVPAYDIEAGKAIVESNCGACHGVNGISIAPAQPNLRDKISATYTNNLWILKQVRALMAS